MKLKMTVQMTQLGLCILQLEMAMVRCMLPKVTEHYWINFLLICAMLLFSLSIKKTQMEQLKKIQMGIRFC
ncbi:hypothetical protein D3C71_1884930 [compost metagenome]